MKKIVFLFLNLVIAVSTANAQKGINFSYLYSSGHKLLMCVDSLAKNVYYDNKFSNQPQTAFNYLPEVNNLSIQIYFDKKDNVKSYRYTILVDNKPILVNQSINEAQLTDVQIPEHLGFKRLGIFPIKGKNVTTLIYNIDKPLNIYKSIFYGKPIPRAKIIGFSKLAKGEHGFYVTWTTDIKDKTNLSFAKKDVGITVVKDKSDIDYLYYISIRDKQTNKIIFKSTAWEYGGLIDDNEFLPYVKIDKSVFKKSGDYEIIIQPYLRWNISPKEKEKYTTRQILSITLDEENFTTKELITSGLLFSLIVGAITGSLVVYIKNRQTKKKVAEQSKQKELAQLQLNSVRSQLNPHFLFNALAGIQNLMNKNEVDNANRYLTKFARLTRNVLESKELISLTDEKKLLDDYLQMEQLRFGFQYKINATTDLDTENIEIPAMLLQPFAENAVKHGIAEKGNAGIIEIAFKKKSSDLILLIKDNGKGFDSSKDYNGLGLALSKNRISLLNTIYKDSPFVLNIQSDMNGTEITIMIKQWL